MLVEQEASTPELEYNVHIQKDSMVRMRDSVRLAGDLYLPTREETPLPGKWPAILIRTPYNKAAVQHPKNAGHFWARHGYACYIQDCRGRHGSEGEFYKYTQEAQDGYDTIEWMATQNWCDGNIGAAGASYLCHVQTSMAILRPPHLKAMFCIKGGFYNAHTSGVRQGGALEFRQMVWAFKEGRVGEEARRDPVVRKAFEETDLAAWLLRYPFKKGYTPISAASSYEAFMFHQIEHGDYSDFWRQIGLNTEEYLPEFVDIPTVYLSSWYDIYARSTVEFYANLSPIKTSPIKLIMGPWPHDSEDQVAGEVDFGPQATLSGNVDDSLAHLELRWFDRWLKGVETGAEHDPAVRYFRMGGGDGHRTPAGNMFHGGEWRTAFSWPPTETKPVALYLDAHGQLSSVSSRDDDGYSGYQYDPHHPLPSIGGNLFPYENILWPGAYDQRERADFFLCEPPYLPLASRPDVLVFRTDPLAEDLEVTGTIDVRLYVSSSAPDTDFTAKIIDEYPPNEDYPHGFAMNVTHGIIRCRYRNSRERAELMAPGQVYEVNITLYPTSNLFQKGHRLRVDIASSNYPHFDINTNTGEPFGSSQRMIVADNKVYHNRRHPSQINLPVARQSGRTNKKDFNKGS